MPRLALALLAVVLAVPALTARADEAPDLEGARKAVASYLDAVKGKKWDAAKKAVHPKTLEAVAEIKKRTRVENHALAAWARVKESYLTAYELGGARETDRGSAVVSSTEEHFSVEDQGTEEGVRAEYLVVRIDGQWFVTDRRLGEGVFKDGAVEAGYEGYFEGEYVLPKPKKKGK